MIINVLKNNLLPHRQYAANCQLLSRSLKYLHNAFFHYLFDKTEFKGTLFLKFGNIFYDGCRIFIDL